MFNVMCEIKIHIYNFSFIKTKSFFLIVKKNSKILNFQILFPNLRSESFLCEPWKI